MLYTNLSKMRVTTNTNEPRHLSFNDGQPVTDGTVKLAVDPEMYGPGGRSHLVILNCDRT
jgi:hypothetical protein